MLSERNLKHMLEVARYMYRHTTDYWPDATEDFKRQMWLLGFLHDIGREFNDKEYHGETARNVLSKALYPYSFEVSKHGIEYDTTLPLRLLNEADMRINADGKRVSLQERVKDVAGNHGYGSKAHLGAKRLAEQIRRNA